MASIFFIDDNMTSIAPFYNILDRQGHAVKVFADPYDAIVQANRAPPDLILIDVRMAGWDGSTTSMMLDEQVNLRRHGTILIAITGELPLLNTGIRERMLEVGCKDFFPKTTPVLTFAERIAEHLANRVPQPDFMPDNQRPGYQSLPMVIWEERTLLMEKMREVAELQEVLIQTQQLAAVGNLLSQLSHEMLNPLAALNYELQCLKLLDRESPAWKKEYDGAVENISRLRQVSDTVLRRQRKDFRTPQQFDLGALIYQTLPLHQRKAEDKHVRLDIQMDQPTAEGISAYPVRGVPSQIQQILGNLIDNATDASPPDGNVTIQLSTRPGPPDRNVIVLRVMDQGTGVAPDARLFELYYSTKSRGHGIGLYTCRLIADAHNAALWHEPNTPTGSIFSLMIDRA